MLNKYIDGKGKELYRKYNVQATGHLWRFACWVINTLTGHLFVSE